MTIRRFLFPSRYAKRVINLYASGGVEVGQSNIVSVKARHCGWKKLRVTVETHRPGLFCGRKGRHISDMTAEMQMEFGCDVEIHLVESRMFANLYPDRVYHKLKYKFLRKLEKLKGIK